MIRDHNDERRGEVVQFGRRPIPPRACIVENKTHVRMFLAEMLDELGFIACEADTLDIRAMLREFRPDLIVLGPLRGGDEVGTLLHALKAQIYSGKVMLFGGRSSSALIRAYEFGEQAGLAMLPPLGTPFRDRDLNANLACFLPVRPPPALPVDVDEALCNGRPELWYQSKINPRSLPKGAEALVRVRHPTWGVVSPAYFVPAANDPYLHGLSQFVIARSLADSMQFAAANHQVQISMHLPLQALEDMHFIDSMMRHLPDKARQNGFLIAVDCVDLVMSLSWYDAWPPSSPRATSAFRSTASMRRVRHSPARRELPVVEMKVDQNTFAAAPTTGSSRRIARKSLRSPAIPAPRSVAEGVETQSDFLVVRDLGFDLLQGHMFAKPMAPHKFERAMLARRYAAVA